MRNVKSFVVRTTALAASLPTYIFVGMGAERLVGAWPLPVVLGAWALFIVAAGVWPFLDARVWGVGRVAAIWTGVLTMTPAIWLAAVSVLDRSAEIGEALSVVVLLAIVVLPQQAIGIALGAFVGAMVRRGSRV